MEAMVQIHRNISQAPVFNLYVAGDIKNSTENVIVVGRIFYLSFYLFICPHIRLFYQIFPILKQ